MFTTKFLMVVTLWLSLSNFPFQAYGDASGDVIPCPAGCVNCPKCEYPCQQPSPPRPRYPSYGAPPPPSPPPYGYSIYGAPPPPPPQDKGYSNCPPAPYTFSPPNPYTNVPYGEGQGSASMLMTVLVPMMMLFSSFIFLF